ncbi:MAG TPA: T9SS type A sorting domain-containing protein [Chitinophagaceae bacterium]
MRLVAKACVMICLIISNLTYSQSGKPTLKWQKTFGGSDLEKYGADANIGGYQRALVVLPDGYVIGGETSSDNGDIVGNHNANTNDIWVARLDTARNIIWSVCLGGTGLETFGSIDQDIDGGFIISGTAGSVDGNVSGNHGGPADAWIVKLSAAGVIQWQKCIGGTKTDIGGYITPVKAEGYIFIGTTYSNDGDVSGNHGTTGDIWVVKLNRAGNIIWQKCFGSTADDLDIAIKATPDGGYIFTGIAQNNSGDVQGFHGSKDIWVVKISATGNLLWQRCLGGLADEWSANIILTPDGGYLVAGTTASYQSGDVTINKGANDAWLVKLDANGQMQWQKTYGGPTYDVFSDAVVLPDQSYVVIGHTNSSLLDISFNRGGYDIWLVKVSASGNLIWEKTFGGTSSEYATSLVLSGIDEYTFVGETFSNNYDVSGNHGLWDIWIGKAGRSNTISGYVYYDLNANNQKDANEPFSSDASVVTEKAGYSRSVITSNGNYSISIDTGTFVTKAIPSVPYYTAVPDSVITTLTTFFNNVNINFGLVPIAGNQDLQVSLFPVDRARPGGEVRYQLLYRNAGTVPVNNVSIKFLKDPRVNVIHALPVNTSTAGDTLIWNLPVLNSLDEGVIDLKLAVGIPPAVNNGDTLKHFAGILPITSDLTPADNTINFQQTVVGSFDPNDKSESHAGKIFTTQVSNRDYLTYLIRFQNTGNDTAFQVVVRDTLDPKLDWSTLEMIGASHPNQLLIKDGNQLTWEFPGIKLADSIVNEPASHGYIVYRIQPKNTVAPGDIIKNSASIYFDFNLPVKTNTENTVVVDMVIVPVRLTQFNAVLNDDIVNLSWKTASEQHTAQFEIERSLNGLQFEKIGVVSASGRINGWVYSYNDHKPTSGYNYYRLKIIDQDGSYVYSGIVLINLSKDTELTLALYPNPSRNGNVTLNISGRINGHLHLDLADVNGRVVFRKSLGVISADSYSTSFYPGKLSKGLYTLRVVVGDKRINHRIIIQ